MFASNGFTLAPSNWAGADCAFGCASRRLNAKPRMKPNWRNVQKLREAEIMRNAPLSSIRVSGLGRKFLRTTLRGDATTGLNLAESLLIFQEAVAVLCVVPPGAAGAIERDPAGIHVGTASFVTETAPCRTDCEGDGRQTNNRAPQQDNHPGLLILYHQSAPGRRSNSRHDWTNKSWIFSQRPHCL
jgi:hypothetical protein